METRSAATQCGELRARIFRGAGLVEDQIAAGGDLIAADHEGVRVASGDRFGLGERQAQGAVRRGLIVPVVLGDFRADDFEGQAQAGEQLAAVRGSGSEDNQRLRGHRSFDLREDDTYDTRPMSEPWSQLLDIDRVADSQDGFDFAIPLTEFPRLPRQPAGPGDVVSGRVQFRRQSGFTVAALDVAGSVQLECQRCLSPMRQAVQSHADVALVAAETAADKAPPGFEPVRAPEGRVRVRDLVEEELLLALPIVPLHDTSRECAPAESVPAIPADEMQKPFERLGELLKRS